MIGRVKEFRAAAVTDDVGSGITDDDRIGTKGDIVTALASSDVEWL